MTDAEFFRRLEFVDGLLREGRARADVVAACEKRFGMSARTCDEYCARSRARWEQQAALAAVDERSATLQRIDALLSRLERERAWSPLISALRLHVDILGLRAPDRMVVEAPKVDPSSESVGLVEVAASHTMATRALVRALRIGLVVPASAKERAELVAALRELAVTLDHALREIRTNSPTG